MLRALIMPIFLKHLEVEPNDKLTDYESFKSKIKITGNTPADGNTKDVEMIVSLKYLSNFFQNY